MARKGTNKRAWTVGAAFAVFSGAVALGWLSGADLWVLRTTQEHRSNFLDAVSNVFSLLGSVEVTGAVLLTLLVGLFLSGRRVLAGRLLAIFVTTGVLELAIKLYLPQTPVPEESVRTEDFAPLAAFVQPYSYPSGHMLRGVVVLGALYLLSGTRLVHAGVLLTLLGLAAARVYPGVHWASDIVGGALLGIAALSWAFGKEDR